MDRVHQAALLTKLVQALRERGSWCGETHIQKAVFFLQELTKVPFGFPFVLYEYGPFSFELRDELGALRADYLLDLEAFESYGSKYYATKRAINLHKRLPKTLAYFSPRIEFVASNLGNSYVDELERLATAYYLMTRSEQEKSVEEIARKLTVVKPHIPPDLATKAVIKTKEIVSDWEDISQ